MPIDTLMLTSALLIGVFGSSHCALMCGGIAVSLSSRCSSASEVLLLQLGRVLAYATAGGICAGFSQAIVHLIQWPELGSFLRALTGVILLLAALRIAGISRFAVRSDPLAHGLWAKLSPFRAKLQGRRSKLATFAVGAVWGWLPCGLSLLMLKAAFLRANVLDGVLLMAAFGVGTMPLLYAISRTGSGFVRKASNRVAAAVLGIAGAVTLGMPWLQARPELHGLLKGLGCIS